MGTFVMASKLSIHFKSARLTDIYCDTSPYRLIHPQSLVDAFVRSHIHVLIQFMLNINTCQCEIVIFFSLVSVVSYC